MKNDCAQRLPATLPELLTDAAAGYPLHGIGFLYPGKETFLTFGELENRALSMLAGMQARGLKQEDLVILSLEKSEEIIPVLWGCFIGGIIPVLLQPPVTFTEYNPAAEKTEKVFQILGQPPVILSHEHARNWQTSHIPANLQIDVALLGRDQVQAARATTGSNDIAMIQFSSGSTGDPKGVMLTHGNIIINTADIIKGIALGASDISVNWMPLYHDMGLIGFHITPVFAGVTQYFIDPADFVKNPAIWLDALSRKRCTITACPNFGQLLVNRYLSRKVSKNWDLSSVRILFNGAEPISVSAMRVFLEGLHEFQLNPLAMFPAYGLAEATLAVTFPSRHTGAEIRAFSRNELLKNGRAIAVTEDEPNAIELVNLGKTLDHCSVMVVNNAYEAVEEGIVGNILVKGENITPGYFGGDDRRAIDFHGDWLITGDLGFIYEGGLFITGRSKDIIFINGINFYAHDLEVIAMKLDGIASGKIVITGDFDEREGRDKLLVFLVGQDNEITRTLCVRLKNHLAAVIGITPETFIPIRSADIPRTSSGKIQRYKLVERYRKGQFQGIIQI